MTSDYLSAHFHLLSTAPDRYRALAEQLIKVEPNNSHGYHARHQALTRLGRHDEALADINIVVRLDPQWITYESRGNVLRNLGRYDEAAEAYNDAEAIDSEGWHGGFGLLFRAECHARLGNEAEALADCAGLREDHWTPGLLGAPAGNKREVAAELSRLAAQAKAVRRR
jgi:tetratricopeptide (TPR) repeat protein